MRRVACALLLHLCLLTIASGSYAQSLPPVIPAGQTVELTGSAFVENLTINGTLKIARNVDTRLTIGCNLIVNQGGRLDLGTGDDPITASHQLVFDISRSESAQFKGGPNFEPTDCGLWIMGHASIHGVPKIRAWGKLDGDVLAGATKVRVAGDISDWPVGGEIGLTDTTPARVDDSPTRFHYNLSNQHETATIASVDGNEITLTAPVQFAHQGSGEMRGEVLLLSRNVVIASQIEGWAPTARGVLDVNRKGAHVTVMPTAHGDGTQVTHSGGGTLDIGWARLDLMGPTGLDGRYPLHFHRDGDNARGTAVEGVAVTRSGNRCINRHESNGILLIDVICWDTGGGAALLNQIDGTQTQIADIASIHTITVGTTGAPSGSAAGEQDGRAVAGHWPGASLHEASIGDVAAGPSMAGGYTTGWHWPEMWTSKNGTIKRRMIDPEAHGFTLAGMYAWQNPDTGGHDIVGCKVWNNGDYGVLHGAYRFDLRWYNCLFARQSIGIARAVIHGHVQQSRFLGRGLNAVKRAPRNFDRGFDRAIAFEGYSIQPDPWAPSRYYDNTFAELTPNVNGEPGTAIYREATTPPLVNSCQPLPSPFNDTQPMVRFCSSAFVRVADNTFGEGVRPYRFGYPYPEYNVGTIFFPNKNSWWIDHDRRLVLLRKDVTVNDGPFPAKLVKPSSFYDPVSDALATPCADALPQMITGLTGYDGNPYANFPMTCTYNAPPKIAIGSYAIDGDLVHLKVDTADTDLTRVEFWVDWVPQPIAIVTQAPYEATIDLANLQAFGDLWPKRNWNWIIVEAFDGVINDAGCGNGDWGNLDRVPHPLGPREPMTFVRGCENGYEQRGYATLEITPEMRRQSAPPPPPDPTIAELQAQIVTLQADIAQRTAELATRTTELATSRAELISTTQQRDSYQAQIAILEQRILALSQALQAIASIAGGVQ